MTFPTHVKVIHNGREVTGRDEDRPANVPIRAWRQIVKAGLGAGAAHWQQTFLPLHFLRTAYFRYPDVYKRRSDSYFRRNYVGAEVPRDGIAAAIADARKNHKPLVHTGRLREVAAVASLRVYQTRATVNIEKLPYVTKFPPHNGVNILAELSAVNGQEVAVLQRIVGRVVRRSFYHYVKTRQAPAVPSGPIPPGLLNLMAV